MMNIPPGLLTLEQERELDKVNAFYLQKEAEVCRHSGPHRLKMRCCQPCLSSSKSASRHCSIRRRSSSHDRASRGARPSSPRSKRASSSSLPISTSSSSSSRSMVRPFQRFLRSGTRHPSPRQRSCTSREPSRSNRSSMRPSSASCRIRPPPAFRNSVPGQMESRSTSTRRLPGM